MAYLEKMQKMFSEKKYAELKSFCEGELSLHQNDIDLLFFYASALEALGEHEKARNYFEKLFNITKEKLFLVCKSIPSFSLGERQTAIRDLEKVKNDEENPHVLFYAFKVAVKNGEIETAQKILYKAFKKSPNETIDNLQKFFEDIKTASMEKRIMFIAIINLLREIKRLQG